MAGVRLVRPEHLAGGDDADRRLALLHRPDLHRRRVRTDQVRRLDIERVEAVARGVIERDVQRLEVVLLGLDLGAIDGIETELQENPRDLIPGLVDGMAAAEFRGAAGQA